MNTTDNKILSSAPTISMLTNTRKIYNEGSFNSFAYNNFNSFENFLKTNKNLSIDNFIEAGDEKDRELLNLCWEVTYFCQYRCSYCYMEDTLTDKFDNSLLNHYKIVLNKLKLRNTPNFNVEVLGGEPTTHPKIFNIIEELNKNKKCKRVELVTNLTKPASFYKKFDNQKYNKLYISGSYHNEYAKNDIFLKKCIELHNMKNCNFYTNINFPAEEEKWDKIFSFMEELNKNNLIFHINLLHPTSTYNGFNFKTDTNKTIEILKKIINYSKNYKGFNLLENNIQRQIRLKDKDNNTVYIPEIFLRSLKLDRFKGWKCTAKVWGIDPKGKFTHDCTNEELDLLNKKFNDCVICPVSNGCRCDLMLNHKKIKI